MIALIDGKSIANGRLRDQIGRFDDAFEAYISAGIEPH